MTNEIDYGKKWFVMLAVSMGVFLAAIDGSIVNLALPTLQKEFNSSLSAIQWVVLAYLLTLATLTLLVGRLGDMLGKKRIYTAGYVAFTAASVLAALSQSVGMLIGFRVLQAVGGAMILSLGVAILTEAFPDRERGKALGFIGTMVSVGIVVGPAAGGFILESLGWRAIFLVSLPVGIVGTLAAIRFVPDVRPAGAERFDYVGAMLMSVGLSSFLLAVTIGQDVGYGTWTIIALFVLAAVCLAAFVLAERRTDHPLIELNMFSNPLFTVNLVTGFLTFVGIAGLFFMLPFYLEDGLGLDPRHMGFLLAALPILLGVVAPMSGTASDRIGSRPLTIVGLGIIVVGYLFLRQLTLATGTVAFLLFSAPVAIGMGMFQSPNNSIVLGSVRPERLGVASGLLNLTRILGQIVGIAVLGTIWNLRRAAFVGPSDEALVAGMHDTFGIIAALVAFGLGLAVWARSRERAQLVATPSTSAGGKSG